MKKEKIKNIALGVSLGFNLLFGSLLGGSLIHSCNSPKTDLNASSSTSSRSLGQVPTLANGVRLKAIETLQTGVEYVFGDTLTAYPVSSVVTVSSDYVLTSFLGEENLDRFVIAYRRLMFVSTAGAGGTSNIEYSFDNQYWFTSSTYPAPAPTIYFNVLPSDDTFVSWLLDNLTLVEEEASSEPLPVDSYELGEHIGISADYDFRRWFGNVDPNVGVIGNSYSSLTSIVVGGLEWVAGDGKLYNAMSFILQPLSRDNTFIVNSDYTAKTAGAIYGDDYDKYAMLSAIYYLYIPDYDGQPIYDALGTNYPSFDYRAQVYYMPLVSGTLDGTNIGVSAIDLRSFSVDKLYRSFDVVENGGNRFSTSAYLDVTIENMLKSNFDTIVSFGNTDTNPFTLLNGAFSSVASILSIAILPNLTLGTLIFIPLVVTIILLIVRLLQK